MAASDKNVDTNDQNIAKPLTSHPPSSENTLDKELRRFRTTVKILALLIIFLVITLIGAFSLILKGNNQRGDNESEAEVTVQPTITTSEPLSKITDNIAFLRDGELWLHNSDGQSEQLSGSDRGVRVYDQKFNTEMIAFTEGEKGSVYGNYYYNVTADSVYIYTSDDDQLQKIYEYKPITYPNSEYQLILRDVAISNDGSKVAITTSDSLLIYDVSKGTLETIFSYPVDNPLRPDVFAYSDPMFSPDNNHIVFSKGYYEGYSYGLVNISSKVVTDLPFSGYIGGPTILGWFDNSTLLLQTYDETGEYEFTPSLKSVKLSDLDNLTTIHELKGEIQSSIIHSDKIYLVLTYDIPNYDVYPDTGIAYQENYSGIYEYDLLSKSERELSTVKQEVIIEDAISISYGKILLSSDGNTLYVSRYVGINNRGTYTPDYIPEIDLFDIESGNEPREYINFASF